MIIRIIVVDTQAELDQMYSADVQRATHVVVRENLPDRDLDLLNNMLEEFCEKVS